MGDPADKRCAACGEGFTNTDGRVRYCERCRPSELEREAENARQRERRLRRQKPSECKDCGAEFIPPMRTGGKYKYCETCRSPEGKRGRENARRRKPPRKCEDCGAYIAHRSNSAKRCEPCSKRWTIETSSARVKEWKQRKRATDPEYVEREKSKARERSRKKRANPEQREKENAKQRAYQNRQYAENPIWREKAKAKVRNRRRALGGKKPHRYGPVLLMRDGSLCHICGSTVYLTEGWHVDHYIPLDAIDQFGDDVVTSCKNLRLTHPACNIAKNNQIPLGLNLKSEA